MAPGGDDGVDIRLLGPLEVVRDETVVEVPGRRERAVLALLAVEVGRPVEVARLTALLWADDVPRTADKTLQTFVSRLRHVLGDVPDRLVRRERAYLLDVPARATDLGRFRALVDDGTAAGAHGDTHGAVAALDAAVALWRGDRPAELGDTPTARTVEQRLLAERTAAEEALVGARLAAGDADGAAADAERGLAARPGHEPLWALLMRAHAAAGRTAAALDAHERCRRWLADELGLDPSPALADLHARILRGDPDLTTRRPPEAPGVVPGDVSAGPGGPDRRLRPPPALTPLAGRDDDLAALSAALDGDRLVTLTGTGGVGKTRLAIEATAGAADAVWCDLTRVGSGGSVEEAVAAAAGVVPPPGVPPVAAASADLAGGDVLLVLDNCEHVLDGARRVVVELLRAVPDLVVLTTSRQPLGIAGERVLAVAPLATGQDGAAIALFTAAVTRAGGEVDAGDEDTALLVRLCERLDGLPLALELAAPLVRTLGLQGVLDGLSRRFALLDVAWDATGRERDLRGTVAWSETLLAPASRQLLRGISVFAGPFTSAMVVEVCDPQVPDVDAALSGLVDRSLVEPVAGTTPRRFRLLENVRAYGRDALGGTALDELRRRHAEWIAHRCDDVYARLWEADEGVLLRLVTGVADEVRAAVDWVVAADDADRALRIAAGMHGPMVMCVRTDLAGWVRTILERFGDHPHPRLAAAWAGWAHWLLVCEGDREGAAAAAVHADAAIGDGGTPHVLWSYRVQVALRAYDVDAALRLLDAARAEGLPEGWTMAIESEIIPTEEAVGRAEQAAARVRRLQPHGERSDSLMLRELSRLGVVLIEHGDEPARVVEVLRDVLAVLLDAELRFAAQLVSMVLATFAGRSGDRHLAVAAFEDVLGRWAAVGAWRYEWNTIREITTLLAACGAHEDVVLLDAAAQASSAAPTLVGEQLEQRDAAMNVARDQLSDRAFRRAQQRGAATTGRDAVIHAREALGRLVETGQGQAVGPS